MSCWKSKLDILNNRIKEANALRKHLDIISEKTEQPKTEEESDVEEKTTSVADVLAKRQISKEKILINAVANIPVYKSAEYHSLDLISRKTKNLSPFSKNNPMSGMVHMSHVKLAKRRLSQILNSLLKDVQKARKEK